MSEIKSYKIDKVNYQFKKFISQEKSGGIVLGLSVIIALILANSPLKHAYHHFFEHTLGFTFDNKTYLNFSLHHWINDGLMAIFFFVVGLELKREIVGGELKNPRKALLPISAALGGMLVPALIYIFLNPTGEQHSGWGIPMATDIAFALGVLYLLGNRIPLSLKVFLTALAIVDDLGAVIVIAFFYTSEISMINLAIGLGFVALMYIGNKIGIKNIFFYAIIGIAGVWMAFLLSGVHATIAAVLAAFTIPCEVRIKEITFIDRIKNHLNKFKAIDPNDSIPTLTSEQIHIIDDMKNEINLATPISQKLEHAMHPIVTFIILPIFALANAGISLDLDINELFSTNVALGVALGLVVGKVVGVVGFTWILIKLKVAPQPDALNFRNLVGLGFIAAIGFTMSIFVTSLAFTNELFITQAKIGIICASLIGGIIGYLILSKNK